MVALTQPTELGTLNTPNEIRVITDHAHARGRTVFLDGALAAEALVVLDPAAVQELPYLRKSQMQLASKMRFVSAQLLALLDGDLAVRLAGHANAMARRLGDAVEAGIADGSLPGVALSQRTQVNAVFATLPAGVADRLRTRFRFYDWDEARGEVRWMCLSLIHI